MKDLNQMAESSFFNFPTLKESEQITLPEEDDNCLENEDEYDALNDETFGDLECDSTVDDWEQQHEKFAEFAKTTSKNDQIVDSLKDLVSSSSPLNFGGNSVWAYTPTPRNGETTPTIQNLLQRAPKRSPLGTGTGDEIDAPKPSFPIPLTIAPKICTVEESEKSSINSKVPPQAAPPNCARPPPPPGYRPMPPVGGPPQAPPYYGAPPFPRPPPSFQGHPYPLGPPGRFPPGFPPGNMAPPIRHMMYGPRFRPLAPPHSFLKGGNMPPRPPPGMPYHNHLNHQGPPHMQRGGMPGMPPHMQNMHPLQQQQQYHHHSQSRQQQHFHYQQQQQGSYQNDRRVGNDSYRDANRDEYEGSMTPREKQWSSNIQSSQSNTGTPYFDDYYYTIYKERKSRSNKENLQQQHMMRRTRHNSDRQENTLTPKVYTPLQFENSSGKLQCGSVMAPRKIIDMDVVSCDKDSEGASAASKDSKKTKQSSLESEASYSMFLKAEDSTNPLAISNSKTSKEIKSKQRIRESENATTQEQKTEISELVKKESEIVTENPQEYMAKIVQASLQDDKFSGFVNIRKGKMLLSRLLPAIHSEQFFPQTVEIWGRLLSSSAVIGRRDTAGDKISPKLYPLFKRYTQTVKMANILDNLKGSTEVSKTENNRSTPISQNSKMPSNFVLTNQFGISASTAFFVRSELSMSAQEGADDAQRAALFDFILFVGDVSPNLSKVPAPLEGMSQSTFNKSCQRIPHSDPDKTALLRRHFVEVHD